MRRIVVLLTMLLALSCVTQKQVERYADKHKERMSKISWDYMDKNKDQASAYCSNRFPLTSVGSSVEVIVDTAAMNELAAQAVSDALMRSDSAWFDFIDSSYAYVSRELVQSIVHQMRREYEGRVDMAVRKAIAQCERGKRVIIRDTVEDSRRIVACEMRYTKINDENTRIAQVNDKLLKENADLKQSRNSWMTRCIATWSLIALLLAIYIAIKIKTRPVKL